jgi:hypothetical protein
VRDRLLESRGSVSTANEGELAHLDACAECAGFARRVGQISSSFSKLARLAPPRELDGLTVGAMQAGRRQERAVVALRGLARLPVPPELVGRALEDPARVVRAPAVLERLVDEDLRNSSGALARRFAGRLERRRAPQALRDRLQRSALSVLRPSAVRRNVLTAAALALLLVGAGLWLRRRSAANEISELGFEIRYESGFEGLDPMARSLLGGLSGGIVDLGPVHPGPGQLGPGHPGPGGDRQ